MIIFGDELEDDRDGGKQSEGISEKDKLGAIDISKDQQ